MQYESVLIVLTVNANVDQETSHQKGHHASTQLRAIARVICVSVSQSSVSPQSVLKHDFPQKLSRHIYGLPVLVPSLRSSLCRGSGARCRGYPVVGVRPKSIWS